MHLAVLHLMDHLAAAPPPFPGFGGRRFPHGVGRQVKVSLLLLIGADLLGCAVLVPRRVRWWGLVVAAALLSFAALWARENKTVEGGILYTITASHGIVVSDMLSVQAGLLALAIVARFGLQRTRSVRPPL